MKQPRRVLITFEFAGMQEAVERVDGYVAEVAPTREAALARIGEADVAVVAGFDPELLARAKRLQWVQAFLGGVERVLFPEFVANPIPLTCVKECFAAPGADHAMASILAVAYRLDYYLRQQSRRTFEYRPPGEVGGRTLGIIGFGNIGKALARRAKAFGMTVVAVARRAPADPAPADEVVTPDRLGEVLARADFLVIAVPQTSQTLGLIGPAQLRQMKPTAHLVDISGRPAIVDQAAVIEALRQGQIAGADLQFAQPPPPDSPLWAMDNLIMSQYSANSNEESARALTMVEENLRHFRDEQPLIGLVDKAAGY